MYKVQSGAVMPLEFEKRLPFIYSFSMTPIYHTITGDLFQKNTNRSIFHLIIYSIIIEYITYWYILALPQPRKQIVILKWQIYDRILYLKAEKVDHIQSVGTSVCNFIYRKSHPCIPGQLALGVFVYIYFPLT